MDWRYCASCACMPPRAIEPNATRCLPVCVEQYERRCPRSRLYHANDIWLRASLQEGAREQNNPTEQQDNVHEPRRYQLQKQITDGNSQSCALAMLELSPDGRFKVVDPGCGIVKTGQVPNPSLCFPLTNPPWQMQDANTCTLLGGSSCGGGGGTCNSSGGSCSSSSTSCGGGGGGDCDGTGAGCSGKSVMPCMPGVPIDNDDAVICIGSMCSFMVQECLNPRNWVQTIRHWSQIAGSTTADLQGQVAQITTRTGYAASTSYLINVANEEAAQRADARSTTRTYAQAIWMVQQMYKQCFVPMAILFLLPGAIITQCKGMISGSMFSDGGGRRGDEDAATPFPGLIRAIVAIFLIPVTQLTVSYLIDVGNSLTDSVRNQINMQKLVQWADAQVYTTNPRRDDNYVGNTPETLAGEVDPFRARMHAGDQETSVTEREVNAGTQMRELFNTTNALLSQTWIVMHGIQLVMMCYLFLLGPIAAALFAWPSGLGRDLFKGVFANWLDAVTVLALWKFWWCLILLCMSVRLELGGVDPRSQYELYYYSAFLALLTYVPFQPFDFKPGPIVANAIDRATQSLRQRPVNPTSGSGTPPSALPG